MAVSYLSAFISNNLLFILKMMGFSRKRYTLIYNAVDGVAYCPIAKVASSTWCGHFLRLGETVDRVTEINAF